MKKTWLIMAAVLCLIALVLVACGDQTSIPTSLMDEGEFERPDPPVDYVNAVNPYEGDPQVTTEGQTLYQANCVSCHGTTGRGDGPAASELNPKPADLSVVQSTLSDGYLYWRITEGGLIEPFRSVMPAWKGILREELVWKVITYIRTLGG